MIGAIVGDVIGSVHEAAGTKTKDFPLFEPYTRFTDDTVLTVAVADSILAGADLVDKLHEYFDRYPQAGYGGSFIGWALHRRREPYGSWGNGSAMRVSPVAYAYEALDEVLHHAERTAAVTHDWRCAGKRDPPGWGDVRRKWTHRFDLRMVQFSLHRRRRRCLRWTTTDASGERIATG